MTTKTKPKKPLSKHMFDASKYTVIGGEGKRMTKEERLILEREKNLGKPVKMWAVKWKGNYYTYYDEELAAANAKQDGGKVVTVEVREILK